MIFPTTHKNQNNKRPCPAVPAGQQHRLNAVSFASRISEARALNKKFDQFLQKTCVSTLESTPYCIACQNWAGVSVCLTCFESLSIMDYTRPVFSAVSPSISVTLKAEDIRKYCLCISIYLDPTVFASDVTITLQDFLACTGNAGTVPKLLYPMLSGAFLEHPKIKGADVLSLGSICRYVAEFSPRMASGHGVFSTCVETVRLAYDSLLEGFTKLATTASGAAADKFGQLTDVFCRRVLSSGFGVGTNLMACLRDAVASVFGMPAQCVWMLAKLLFRVALDYSPTALVFEIFVDLAENLVPMVVANMGVKGTSGEQASGLALMSFVAYTASLSYPNIAQHVKGLTPFALFFQRCGLGDIIARASLWMSGPTAALAALQVCDEAHTYLTTLYTATEKDKRTAVFHRRLRQEFDSWKRAKAGLTERQLHSLIAFKSDLDSLPEWASTGSVVETNKPFGIVLHGLPGIGKSIMSHALATAARAYSIKQGYISGAMTMDTYYYEMGTRKHQDAGSHPVALRLDDIFTKKEGPGTVNSDAEKIMNMMNSNGFQPEMAFKKREIWYLALVVATSNQDMAGIVHNASKVIHNADAIPRRFENWVQLTLADGVTSNFGKFQGGKPVMHHNWRLTVRDPANNVLASRMALADYCTEFLFPGLDAYYGAPINSCVSAELLEELGLPDVKHDRKDGISRLPAPDDEEVVVPKSLQREVHILPKDKGPEDKEEPADAVMEVNGTANEPCDLQMDELDTCVDVHQYLQAQKIDLSVKLHPTWDIVPNCQEAYPFGDDDYYITINGRVVKTTDSRLIYHTEPPFAVLVHALTDEALELLRLLRKDHTFFTYGHFDENQLATLDQSFGGTVQDFYESYSAPEKLEKKAKRRREANMAGQTYFVTADLGGPDWHGDNDVRLSQPDIDWDGDYCFRAKEDTPTARDTIEWLRSLPRDIRQKITEGYAKNEERVNFWAGLGACVLFSASMAFVAKRWAFQKDIENTEISSILHTHSDGQHVSIGYHDYVVRNVVLGGGKTVKALVSATAGTANHIPRNQMNVHNTLEQLRGKLPNNVVERESAMRRSLGALYYKGQLMVALTFVSANEAITVAHMITKKMEASDFRVMHGATSHNVIKILVDRELDVSYIYFSGMASVKSNVLSSTVDHGVMSQGLRVLPHGFAQCTVKPERWQSYIYKSGHYTTMCREINLPSVQGDCGQPVFVGQFLAGIVCAGREDGTLAYIAPVPLDFVDKCRKQVGRIQFTARPVTDVPAKSAVANVAADAGVNVLGGAPHYVPLGGKTKFAKIDEICPKLERAYEPAHAQKFVNRQGEEVSPLKVRLRNFIKAKERSRNGAGYTPKQLAECAKWIKQQFDDEPANMYFRYRRGKLTCDWQAVVESIPELSIRKVDPSRAAGGSAPGASKSIFYDGLKLSDVALGVLDKLLEDLCEGITTGECAVAAFKDEVLLLDKADKGSTRVFTAEGFFRYVIMRALFMPAIVAFNQHGHKVGIMAAMDPQQVGKFVHRTTGGKTVLATDVSKQDYSHSGFSWDAFFELLYLAGLLPKLGCVVNRHGRSLDLLNSVRLTVLKDIEHSPWWMGDVYINSESSVPSGFLLTFLMNTVVACLNAYEVARRCEKEGIPAPEFMLYGDDQWTLVLGVLPKEQKRRIMELVLEVNASHGYTLTVDGQGYQDVHQSIFCGRRFCLSETTGPSMALTRPRWAKIVQFCPQNQYFELYPMRLFTALYELRYCEVHDAKERFKALKWDGGCKMKNFISFSSVYGGTVSVEEMQKACEDFACARPCAVYGTAAGTTEIPDDVTEVDRTAIVQVTTTQDIKEASQSGFHDQENSVAFTGDDSMADIFARPVRVGTVDWQSLTEGQSVFSCLPLSLFFEKSKNQRLKLANNALVSCTVVISVVMAPVLNASGAFITQCIPCGRRPEGWQQMLSAPSTIVDVARNRTSKIKVQYCRDTLAASVAGYVTSGEQYFDFARYDCLVVYPYTTGTSGDGIPTEFYVHLEDVTLATGTVASMGTAFDGDEAATGPTVPSAFQRTAKMAFTGGTQAVRAAGITQVIPAVTSKPQQCEPPKLYVPRPARHMVNHNGAVTSVSSTLNDGAMPVPRPSLDDSSMPVDSLANFCAREGYIMHKDITSSTVAGTLFVIPCTPAIETGVTGIFPPMAFAAGLHRYWHGDLVYRFQLFGSNAVNAVFRFTVVYDFISATTTLDEDARSVCYSEVVSMTGLRELQIVVPYMRPWPMDTTEFFSVDTTPIIPKLFVELSTALTTSSVCSDACRLLCTGSLANARMSWPAAQLSVTYSDFTASSSAEEPRSSKNVSAKGKEKQHPNSFAHERLNLRVLGATTVGTANDMGDPSGIFAEAGISEHPRYVLGKQGSYDSLKATAYFHGGDITPALGSLLQRALRLSSLTVAQDDVVALWDPTNTSDIPDVWWLILSTCVFCTGVFNVFATESSTSSMTFVTQNMSGTVVTDLEPVQFWARLPSEVIEVTTSHQSRFQTWVAKDFVNQVPVRVMTVAGYARLLYRAVSMADGFKMSVPDVLPLATLTNLSFTNGFSPYQILPPLT